MDSPLSHRNTMSPTRADARPRPPVSTSGPRLVLAAALLLSAALQAGTPHTGNIVPNPSLRGDQGTVIQVNASVTGTAPTLWRAFAIDGGALSLERLELGANALFAGSPPTQAVKITVSAFGADQGLDHATAMFSFRVGNSYSFRVYARSGNADNSTQMFDLSMPIFDSEQNFTSRHAVGFSATAGVAWAAFDSPVAAAVAGDAFAHIAIRVSDDGGENSLIVALPSVLGPAVFNLAPNPEFSGTSGETLGTVNGSVPDNWRAFAVGAGTLNLSTVPVAAGALFPGSLPTRAVRMEVIGGNGADEGFDHEGTRASLSSDYLHWGELYVRSGNSDMSDQGMTIGMPIFDPSGAFHGQVPGSFDTTVGSDWAYVAGPAFTATAGETTDISVRLHADGGQDVLLIASPRIIGPIGSMIFRDIFELD